jgi:hypothetical protein
MDDLAPLRCYSQRRNGNSGATAQQTAVIREVERTGFYLVNKQQYGGARDANPGAVFVRERASVKTPPPDEPWMGQSQSCSRRSLQVRDELSHKRIQRVPERRMRFTGVLPSVVIGRVAIDDSDTVSRAAVGVIVILDDFAAEPSQVMTGRLIEGDEDFTSSGGQENFRRRNELFARRSSAKDVPTSLLPHGGRHLTTPHVEGTGSAHRLPLIDEDETEMTVIPDIAAMMYGTMTEREFLLQDNNMSGLSHDGTNSSSFKNSSSTSSSLERQINDVMEIFPDVSLTRVEELLRGCSLTSTLILLAEESNNPGPDSKRQASYEESPSDKNVNGFDHHPRQDETMSRVLDDNNPEAKVSDVDCRLMNSRQSPGGPAVLSDTKQNEEDVSVTERLTEELQQVDRRPALPLGGRCEIGLEPQTDSGLARQASYTSFFRSTLDVDVPVDPIKQNAAGASAPVFSKRSKSFDEYYYIARPKHGCVARRQPANDTDSSSDEGECCKPRSKRSPKGPSLDREMSPTLDDLMQLLGREQRQNREVLNSAMLSQCYDISTAALL